MKSALPKVMHKVAGEPMIGHVIRAVTPLAPERVVVVVAPDMESVTTAVRPHQTVVQDRALGTGHAVRAAVAALAGFEGTILVLLGDGPLIGTDSLRRLVEAREGPGDPAVVMMGMRPADPAAFGRLVMGASGLERIVEAADATADEKAIGLVWAGQMAADGRIFFDLLAQIGNDNAKGEYYLTTVVAKARAAGRGCAVVEAPEEESLGVDSRAILAVAEGIMQRRLREAAMTNGATLTDPASVFLSADTVLGRDVVIGPNVVFGPGVTVGDDVRIEAFCHIAGARISSGAVVGPFARLRPGSELGKGAHVGNFVEIKNAVLGQGAKANHLAYIGDASVGSGSNIGAGVITCNYDGFAKHRTTIGDNCFIGSDTALVAPITVGDGAIIGAGSILTKDVPADALALSRAPQINREGRAVAFRNLKRRRT